jgi:hypothetical protein
VTLADPLDHIQRLERACRFWRTTTFCLVAFIFVLLLVGVSGLTLSFQRSARAMEAALQARDQAEAARQQAVRAEEQARPKPGP